MVRTENKTNERPKSKVVNKNEDELYKVTYVKPSSNNVDTGVGSATGIVATLTTAVGGLFVSKKRKNK